MCSMVLQSLFCLPPPARTVMLNFQSHTLSPSLSAFLFPSPTAKRILSSTLAGSCNSTDNAACGRPRCQPFWAKKSLQCFAICAFPVSVAVARSQTRSSSPFPLTDTFFICSKYPVMHRMLLMLRCTVAVAVSSTEPGHAWELLTKQTAEARTACPVRKGNARYGVCMPQRIGIGRIGHTAQSGVC